MCIIIGWQTLCQQPIKVDLISDNTSRLSLVCQVGEHLFEGGGRVFISVFPHLKTPKNIVKDEARRFHVETA